MDTDVIYGTPEMPAAGLRMRWPWVVAGVALLLFNDRAAMAQGLNQPVVHPCGSLSNAYGPLDYRTEKAALAIVDVAHFTPGVESLISGNRGVLGSDLDYTLRASPNHHRALISVAKYGIRSKLLQPKDLPRTVECYFDRAIRFRPDDHLVRMIYAEYLKQLGRQIDALNQLDTVIGNPKLAAPTLENVGLFFIDLQAFDKALMLVDRIRAEGEEPQQLLTKLKELGRLPASPTGGAPK